MSIISKKVKNANYVPSPTGVKGRYSDIICFNEITQERTNFGKLDPNTDYPVILLKGIAHIFIIKGVLIINDQTFEENTYLRIEKNTKIKMKSNVGCEGLFIWTEGFERFSSEK